MGSVKVKLKAAQLWSQDRQPLGELLETLDVDYKQVDSMHIDEFDPKSLNARPTSGFLDCDISGRKKVHVRELQRWQPSEPVDMNNELLGALGDEAPKGDASRRFAESGMDPYDESKYTSQLDKSSDFYKKHEKKAERMAAKINTKETDNRLDERGGATSERVQASDSTEALPTNTNASVYVPPHRKNKQIQPKQKKS